MSGWSHADKPDDVVRALTWQGKRSVSVEQVPDPTLQSSTDAIIGTYSAKQIHDADMVTMYVKGDRASRHFLPILPKDILHGLKTAVPQHRLTF